MPIGRPLCRVGVRWVSVDTLSRSKNTSVGRQGKSRPETLSGTPGYREKRAAEAIQSGPEWGAGRGRCTQEP